MDKHVTHFWEGCAQGELRYQLCGTCAATQYHARPFCARCGGTDLEWRAAAGTGRVYALTRVERAPSEEFRALAPYVILLVDMDEGFRSMAYGAPGLAIGTRVRVDFIERGGRRLPHFDKEV